MQPVMQKDNIRLTGKNVTTDILSDVSRRVTQLADSGWQPRLMSIRVGSDPSVELYIRNQRKRAEKVGIAFEEKIFSEGVSQAELTAAIRSMNVDPSVTGIIIQRPVPPQLSIKALQTAIHPLKDVEGVHPRSIGNIVYDELELGPCTAVASVELLRSTGLPLKGLEVTIIGHSVIVGKPIAFLLMAEGATVTVCHHMTRAVAIHSRRSDAILVAVGKPRLITGDMIKPGAAVIDIGINQIEEDGQTKVVGDCDYDSCHEVAGWITPVPGGVGPVTVAVLMRNTVVAAERQKEHYEVHYRESNFEPVNR